MKSHSVHITRVSVFLLTGYVFCLLVFRWTSVSEFSTFIGSLLWTSSSTKLHGL